MKEENPLEEGSTLLLQFEKRGGLLPVVVQDTHSGEVLMVGYTDKAAFDLTQESGFAHFYSTSRQKLWKKGETSGDLLPVSEIRVDCDQDALLFKVEPVGGVCHTLDKEGNHRLTCFYRSVGSSGLKHEAR